ncbi:fatty acid desaturase family protein [Streptomyces sp. CA-294286]|uniref:fatty acid desaturase family protein n=1 Tax=Streptomyces sp. CA-294286 TaxID=3240070 RepID=UPI003D8B63BF
MPSATSAAERSSPGASVGSDFAPLLRTVREQGLLERRHGWYAARVAVNLAGHAAVLTGIAFLGHTWWVLLLTVPFALVWTRTAYLSHDAGHAQISSSRRTGTWISLTHANLLLGMSQAWWNEKHNRHHANPNHVEKDPDVGVGALVWTQQQAAGREGFARWLARHQSRLFFPMLLLEGFALKLYGFQDLRRQKGRERWTEAALLVAHLALYAVLLLTAMSPLKALAFALLHHALFGLQLGMAFAPNHKGMEMPDADGERWGHLRRQVVTSRNVRGGPLTDWFLGGLNYQIEHHLFPNMPRPHLRLAQPLVRAHCREVGLPYAETGLIDSYRQALGHLNEVGEPLRGANAPRAAPSRAAAPSTAHSRGNRPPQDSSS